MCCSRLAGNTGRKNDAKNRHLHTIAQFCRAISSQLRQVWTIGKNLLSSNISTRCLNITVNVGPLMAEIGRVVWGTPANFNGVRASWQRYCTVLQQWTSAKLCGVGQTTPPIFSRAAITLGIGPHSGLFIYVTFYVSNF